MKNSMYKIIIGAVFFLLVNVGTAQSFTADSVKFYKEVSAYLTGISKAKSKSFLKEFEESWYGGKFSPSQRGAVYSTSNLILSKKLKPFPDFTNYLKAVMFFVESEKSNKEFEEWQDILTKILNGRNKNKMRSFLKTSRQLFEDNTIFESSSTKWQASNDKYRFVFDKDPYIVFDEMNLKCYSKRDSSVIYKTKGTYYPVTSKWIGTGGKVTWERADLPKDKFYATFSDYEIGMKSAKFEIDSVDFYSTYFDEPLKGKLVDKVLANRGADKVAYPKFESYNKRLLIKDIFPSIDYDGGFTLSGRNLLGAGTIDNLAKLIFYKDGKEFCTAEALNFVINSEAIGSQKSSIKIKIDDAFISHPGLELKYTDKDKKLTLVRGGTGIALSPFYNDYHKMEMLFEALTWKLGDPVLQFGAMFGSTDSSALFSSYDYFDRNIYERLGAGGGVNPLIRIKAYAHQVASDELDLAGLATSMGKTKAGLEPTLFVLTTMGFITYDKDREKVYVKQKLYHYINARKKKEDCYTKRGCRHTKGPTSSKCKSDK